MWGGMNSFILPKQVWSQSEHHEISPKVESASALTLYSPAFRNAEINFVCKSSSLWYSATSIQLTKAKMSTDEVRHCYS